MITDIKTEILLLKEEVKEIKAMLLKLLDIKKEEYKKDAVCSHKSIHDEMSEIMALGSTGSVSNNRFSKKYIEKGILTEDEIGLIMGEYEQNKIWTGFRLQNRIFNSLKIDENKIIADFMSEKLYKTIFPKLIDLYSLKVNLYFNIINLAIINTNDEKDDKIESYKERNTLFTFVIPLKMDAEFKLRINNEPYVIEKGDIFVYCGNTAITIDTKHEYLLIGNIDLALHK